MDSDVAWQSSIKSVKKIAKIKLGHDTEWPNLEH